MAARTDIHAPSTIGLAGAPTGWAGAAPRWRVPRVGPLHAVALVGLVALLGAGGYRSYRAGALQSASAARPAAAEASLGTIQAVVSANGTVASPTQSRLAFKIGGRLKDMLVSIGQPVSEGQPLARIDDSDLVVAVQQAQAGLRSAEARLDLVRSGARPEDLDAAQAQVEAARAKLAEARAAVNGPELAGALSQLETARVRLRQLLDGGRQEDVTAASSQLESALARQHALVNPRAEDVNTAEAALHAATQRYQALVNPRAEDVNTAQSVADSARIRLLQLQNPRPEDIRNAEAALAGAKAKLQALQSPRPEDVAAAQAAVEQQRARLAGLVNEPIAAKPEDIANAELQVQVAQVGLDKALADAADPSKAGLGGFSLSEQSAAAAVQQAQINLEVAQNTLRKLQTVGPTEHDLRAQQQALAQAQANLDKIRNPSPNDLQAAQSAVDQAQATLDKIKNPTFYDLAAAQEMVKQAQATLDKLKHPSTADVAAAQQAVVQAQTTLEKLRSPAPADLQSVQQAVVQAQTTLEKLRSPLDPDVQAAQQAVSQAEANVERLRNATAFGAQQAEAALRQAQAVLDLKRNGAASQDVAIAVAAVEQARAQLRQAQTNLDAAVLTAPYSGVVSAVIGNLGEMLSPSVPVVALVDTRELRVDVAVDETDVAKLQPGQEVWLVFDALPGTRVPGSVDVIAPTAVVQQGVVSYAVQIKVDPAHAPGVRPGMTVTANVVVASKDGVVLVPNRALKMIGDSPAVEVLLPNGLRDVRPVQTGLASDEVTEIVSGVSAGERVTLPKTGLDHTMPPQGTLAGTTGAAGGAGAAGAAGLDASGGTGPAGLGPARGVR